MTSWKFTDGRRHFRTLCGSLVAGVLLAGGVAAQEDSAALAEDTKVVPALRFQIGEQLSEANTCMEEGDYECAQELIERVAGIRDLNTYEEAQLYNFSAFLAFELDDSPAAVEAYEKMMALDRTELPNGLIQTSMRNLATLYLQEERWDEGLSLYLEWLDLPFVTPASNDYALLGNIYYQLERYADGIPALHRAIELAEAAGEMPQENWYTLLYVFHFQLEQTQEVIETLTILVENWTKRQHMLALAGQLSEQERHNDTLTLYEAAYEAGYLERGTEWVQLANLYLNADVPYKAATLLEEGLSSGLIESSQNNWRLLAQAWQLSQNHENAIPALERASSLADDGEIDRMLGQSYIQLARWEECAEASRSALDRGGLREPAYVQIQLGTCLLNMREFQQARNAFVAASDDETRQNEAQTFVRYVDEEIRRQRANQEALDSLASR